MESVINKISENITIVFFVFALGVLKFSTLHAEPPVCIKIDANKQIIAVWTEIDAEAQASAVVGSYGKINPVKKKLSNSATTSSFNPVVAISSESGSAVLGVVVWKALEQNTNKQILQLTTVSVNGWSESPAVTISDSSIETPLDDYGVDISQDGELIAVSWSSFITETASRVMRRIYSEDGGLTWSSPETL